MGRRPVDLTGQRFGRLVAVEPAGKDRRGKTLWRCICDCGSEKNINAAELTRTGTRRGTRSCGCLSRDAFVSRSKRHGCSSVDGGGRTPEYAAWKAMRTRCNNEKCAQFHNYGGRGIRVCERWQNSFEDFLADMGERPSGKHSVDRINVNGDYEPTNCRWATASEQCRNRRNNVTLTIDGRTQTAIAWGEEVGVRKELVKERLRLGWSAHDAVFKPPRRKVTRL